MQILYGYLKRYWKLLALALGLAAINQIFSLIDPYLFRLILDNYATKFEHIARSDFFRGVGVLLLLSMGFHPYVQVGRDEKFVN